MYILHVVFLFSMSATLGEKTSDDEGEEDNEGEEDKEGEEDDPEGNIYTVLRRNFQEGKLERKAYKGEKSLF